MRRDPLTGDWVVISGSRQGRPNLPSTDCPFCVGGLEAPETYDAKAFANRWPSLLSGPPLETDADEQATTLPGRGACEVVLYSPQHEGSLATIGVERVRNVIDLWAQRTEELLARDEIEYVLVFENRGSEVGATIPHPHGQIYAFPFVPPVPRREAELAARHGCQICELVASVSDDLVVATAGEWSASVPAATGWPYGLLVYPRSHTTGLPELSEPQRDGFAALLADVVARYDRLFEAPFPYMFWIHHGVHLHAHFAPPWRSANTMRYVAAGELGSGMLFNPVRPEKAAAALRNA